MGKAAPTKKKSPAKRTPPSNGGSAVKKALPWALAAVAVGILVLLLLRAGGSGGGIRNVDSAGLLEAQKNGANIIDVRTAGEYAMGHIEGSVNVPIGQLERSAEGWDRNEEYVLYCATGSRSLEGQRQMAALGFKNVANLAKGLAAWTGPLEKGETTSQKSIPTSGTPVVIEFFTPT